MSETLDPRAAVSALLTSRTRSVARRVQWDQEASRLLSEAQALLAGVTEVSVQYDQNARMLTIIFGNGYLYPNTPMIEDGALLTIAQDALSGKIGVAHFEFAPFDIRESGGHREAKIHCWLEPGEVVRALPSLVAKFLAWALPTSPTEKEPTVRSIGFGRL